MDYTRYLTLDGNVVVDAFVNWQKTPTPDSIKVGESNDRAWDFQVNNTNGLPQWKYVNGQIVKRDQSEMYGSGEWFERKKDEKKKAISGRTGELLGGGFIYEGQKFGTSITDQVNWTSLLELDRLGVIQYPVHVQNWEGIAVSFVDSAAVVACYVSGAQRKMKILSDDAMLTKLVDAAKTMVDLDKIQDTRQ